MIKKLIMTVVVLFSIVGLSFGAVGGIPPETGAESLCVMDIAEGNVFVEIVFDPVYFNNLGDDWGIGIYAFGTNPDGSVYDMVGNTELGCITLFGSGVTSSLPGNRLPMDLTWLTFDSSNVINHFTGGSAPIGNEFGVCFWQDDGENEIEYMTHAELSTNREDHFDIYDIGCGSLIVHEHFCMAMIGAKPECIPTPIPSTFMLISGGLGCMLMFRKKS